jgi:hypothetical protein
MSSAPPWGSALFVQPRAPFAGAWPVPCRKMVMPGAGGVTIVPNAWLCLLWAGRIGGMSHFPLVVGPREQYGGGYGSPRRPWAGVGGGSAFARNRGECGSVIRALCGVVPKSGRGACSTP